MHPYHNTKHVHISLGTANINAYVHDISLPGCVTVNKRNNSAVKSSNLAIATFFNQCNEAMEESLIVLKQ
jgi:hypothetical protein